MHGVGAQYCVELSLRMRLKPLAKACVFFLSLSFGNNTAS